MSAMALSDHFGLSALPFAAGEAAMPLASIEHVVGQALAAVAGGERLIVLTARAGGGKTSALKLLADRLRDHGGTVRAVQRDETLPGDQQIDADMLLIDEAPAWDERKLNDVLTAARDGNIPVCLAATEGSPLATLADAHILPLPPIGASDAEQYLQDRVIAAGGAPDLFEQQVAAYIAQFADGSLFRLRQLAGAALIEAMFAGRDRVTRADVDAALPTIPGSVETAPAAPMEQPEPEPETPAEHVPVVLADDAAGSHHRATRAALVSFALLFIALLGLWLIPGPSSEQRGETQLASRSSPGSSDAIRATADPIVDLPTLDANAKPGPVEMATIDTGEDMNMETGEIATVTPDALLPVAKAAANRPPAPRQPAAPPVARAPEAAPAEAAPAAVLVEFQRGNRASKRRAESLVAALTSAGWAVAGTRAVEEPLIRAAIISDRGPEDGPSRQLASWVSSTLIGDLAAQGTIVQPPAAADPLPPHVMAIRIP